MTRTNREQYTSNQRTYPVVQNTSNVLEISSNFQGVLGHTNSCGDGRPLRVSERSSNGEKASRNEAGLRVEEVVLRYRCLPLAGLDVHEARSGPGGSVHGERANFTGLVLGCIDADFCK